MRIYALVALASIALLIAPASSAGTIVEHAVDAGDCIGSLQTPPGDCVETFNEIFFDHVNDCFRYGPPC